MKKRLLFLIIPLSFLLTLIVVRPTYSQTQVSDEFRDAMSEYQKVYSDYNSAREEYVLKRSQYLSYKTLKSQTDAYDATLNLLKIRDDVYVKYIGVLSVKLKEAVGVSDEKKNFLQTRLDTEISWYNNHKNSLPSAGTLTDLERDSKTAETHREISEQLFYETLANIIDGQITDYNERTKKHLSDIKTKIDEIKQDTSEEAFGTEKISLIDRWIFDSESRIVRAEQKQQEAQTEMLKLERQNPDKLAAQFSDIVKIYEESKIYLKEANAFLGEVIAEIKRAD